MPRWKGETRVEGFTREQYLVRSGGWYDGFLVKDGIWYERGDLGLRADVNDERAAEWRVFVDELIAALPGDALITMVSCHT